MTFQDPTLSFIPIEQEGADVCHYPSRPEPEGAGIFVALQLGAGFGHGLRPRSLPGYDRAPGIHQYSGGLMALSRPPRRRLLQLLLLQRLPLRPRPLLKEPGTSKPLPVTRGTLPSPPHKGAEPAPMARRRPSPKAAEPMKTIRPLRSRTRGN